MRFEQLEYVAAVTRLGSLRRAGEELHISQPALSETVRNLERELGVTLLDRRRSGSRISADGRELLPHIVDILDAVDRLRAAADHQHRSRRVIRIGAVNAAAPPMLMPAVREFSDAMPGTQVEVLNIEHADIHRRLGEGSVDLGLVNLFGGDDSPADLATLELLPGRLVVCCRPDSHLAQLPWVTPDELRNEPITAMRADHLMHRFMHRAFGGEPPEFAYATDGAQMGKFLVAHGLGVTVLPDYSVAGDPLERAGAITYRPLKVVGADLGTIRLVIQHRRAHHLAQRLRTMLAILAAHTRSGREPNRLRPVSSTQGRQ